MHFTNNSYSVYAVNNVGNAFWWDVGVYIGFSFQIQNEYLVISPFINAWVYSAGHVWRCFSVKLLATNVTFMPDEKTSVNVIRS